MDKETLKALKASVRKWKRQVKNPFLPTGWDNCPLCKLFHPSSGSSRVIMTKDCYGCPVQAKTGTPYCIDTPYDEWDYHKANWHEFEVDANCAECKEFIAEELEFLKGLLEEAK